jgi:uncharacterized protein YndB with AHSA1/START domain
MSEPEPLTATITIDASAAEVFPYLIDPSLLTRWIGRWADLDPRPGGLFALDVGSAAVRGTFVVVEPPERVMITWGVPGSDELPPGESTVEILLSAEGDQTVVELTHRGLSDDQRARHQRGWASYLPALADAVR